MTMGVEIVEMSKSTKARKKAIANGVAGRKRIAAEWHDGGRARERVRRLYLSTSGHRD